MKLYEIENESVVSVEMKDGSSESISAKVIAKNEYKKYLVLNIPSPGLNKCKVKIVFTGKNGLIIWDSVVLNSVEANPSHYIIISDADSKSINRRDSYRLDIFKPATITVHVKGVRNDVKLNVTLKDLSALGFCFFIKDELTDDLKAAELKKLSFEDGDFELNCNFTIMREVAVEGVYFYGCKFNSLPAGGKLEKYLSAEQLKFLKAKRRSAK